MPVELSLSLLLHVQLSHLLSELGDLGVCLLLGVGLPGGKDGILLRTRDDGTPSCPAECTG